MKIKINLCFVLVGLVLFHAPSGRTEAPKTGKAKLYDEGADGSKQIDAALEKAKIEKKRVLLQFGANWCGWCHKLDGLFESDKAIAESLKQNYLVVLIDVNKGHNALVNQKYGNPTRFGLPVIVILDSDGKQLTTKDTAQLEKGPNHDPAKVLAFLKEWAPAK